jgi:beta-galactosidase
MKTIGITAVSIVCLLFVQPGCKNRSQPGEVKSFKPGQLWKDTDGKVINAHGGGILYHNGTYYWYGELKVGRTTLVERQSWECYRVEAMGVSCYSSKNLTDWKFEGNVLPSVADDTSNDLHTTKVIERPKVIYNEATRKFVMWLHIESADYSKARAGVAVADSPAGPFRYLESFRPNGAMSRDQSVFKDTDGKAYQFFSSENNATMHVSLLTDDYLRPSGNEKRIFAGLSREAPAVFKHENKYYIITSACTGWDSNAAMVAVADSIMGDWTVIGNPCMGEGSELTFTAQSTFVIPVEGKAGTYIFMADRWNKTDLPDSRYVWLPLTFEDGKPVIRWKDEWSLQE